jgi:hypothetical protein
MLLSRKLLAWPDWISLTGQLSARSSTQHIDHWRRRQTKCLTPRINNLPQHLAGPTGSIGTPWSIVYNKSPDVVRNVPKSPINRQLNTEGS